jgi:hypothetical protein
MNNDISLSIIHRLDDCTDVSEMMSETNPGQELKPAIIGFNSTSVEEATIEHSLTESLASVPISTPALQNMDSTDNSVSHESTEPGLNSLVGHVTIPTDEVTEISSSASETESNQGEDPGTPTDRDAAVSLEMERQGADGMVLHLWPNRFVPNRLLWITLGTFVFAGFFVMYWIVAVSSPSALSKILFPLNHSSWTIFTIAALGSVTVFLLNILIGTSCENLKWRLSTRDGGVSLLDFLVLSKSTSWDSLLLLLVARPQNVTDGAKRPVWASFKTWSLLRYVHLQ